MGIQEDMVVQFSNGVRVINVTKYPIIFLDEGEDVLVPASGIEIKTRSVERVFREGMPSIIETQLVKDEASIKILQELKKTYPNVCIVGTTTTAQVYPNEIVAPMPTTGFEFVPSHEKRISVKNL